LGLRFQHLVWRKQKLSEQRVLMAERLARLHASSWIMTHGAPLEVRAALDVAGQYLELFSLLVQIQVLFDGKDTLAAGNALKTALDEGPPNTATEERQQRLYALRVQLLACVNAEAFGISVKKLRRRAQAG
jgi:hypothetical protein